MPAGEVLEDLLQVAKLLPQPPKDTRLGNPNGPGAHMQFAGESQRSAEFGAAAVWTES